MFPRLVLAFVFATLAFIGIVARSLETEQAFTVVVRMTATAGGMVEVFPDVGNGYQGSFSMAQASQASSEPHDYKFPIPPGGYTALRLDPGVGPGIYSIERVEILDPGGGVAATIPLDELQLEHHLRVIERAPGRLVVECPLESFDPQLVYRPAASINLLPTGRTVAALARIFLLFLGVGFALLWLIQLAVGRMAPIASQRIEAAAFGAAKHPQATLLVAALVATIASMYPVLLLGRSLVSPNNGGTVMLFDRPPYLPGSSDIDIEEGRGVDVGAGMWQFVPYSVMQREALAAGEFPLWNRHAGPGRPLWGQGQSFLLDPLHWLTFLSDNPAPGWDLKFAAHRFVFAWGIGVAAFIATGSWPAAAIVAIMAPFSSLFAFRLNHGAAFVVTYAPWIAAGWFLLARAANRRQRAAAGVLIAAASTLLLYGAPPKEAVAMLLIAEATGVLALVLQTGLGRRLMPAMVTAAAAGVATILLTAPHWLIFLDTLRASTTAYDEPRAYFASIGFLLPMALGPLTDGMPLPGMQALFFAAMVTTLVSPGNLLRHRATLACLLGGVASIAIALGVIPEATITRIPLIANIYSFHVTFLTSALVPLLLASTAGVDALLRGSRTRTIVATLAILAAAVWLFNLAGGSGSLGVFRGWLALGAFIGALLVPATLLTATRTFPRVLPQAAAAALACLLLMPSGEQLETRIPLLDRLLLQPRPRVDLTLPSPSIEAIHARGGAPVRTLGVGSTLYQGTAALFGLEAIGGPDALYQAVSDELILAGSVLQQGWARIFLPVHLRPSTTLLDMLNVGYLLASEGDAPFIGTDLPTAAPDNTRAIPRPTAWPRAFFVDRVGRYTNPADLLAQATAAKHPIAAILATDDTAAAATRHLSSGQAEPIAATGYRLTPNTTTFHVRAPHAGVAVVAETYMPDDFVATLNGEAVPYFRVDHAFKGVAIPGEGDWEIRFEYRPRRWTLALGLAALGVLTLIAMAAAAGRRSATAETR